MKLFGSKKDKKIQPTSDNDALNDLINDTPSQLNDPVATTDSTAKQVKTGVSSNGKSDATDDFLASLDQKPKKNDSKNLKWLLIALSVLLLIMVLYFVYSTFIANNKNTNPDEALPTLSEGAEPVPVLETDQSLEAQTLDIEGMDADSDTVIVDTETTQVDEAQVEPEINTLEDIPDPDEIISAELPATEVMAKEEIDRLADEAAQLEEQGKLIADQVAMMDELTDKKAEQIELLEQQIALLEAQKNTQ